MHKVFNHFQFLPTMSKQLFMPNLDVNNYAAYVHTSVDGEVSLHEVVIFARCDRILPAKAGDTYSASFFRERRSR